MRAVDPSAGHGRGDGPAPLVPARAFLRGRRLLVLRAVLCTLFEPGTGAAAEARIAATLGEVRAYLERAGLQTRVAFRAALIAVQWAPLLLLRRLRRFVRLAPAERARCLVRFERSPFGLALVLLKTVLCLHWFDRPDVLARTGYDGIGLRGPAWAEGAEPPVARRLPVLSEPAASAAEGGW